MDDFAPLRKSILYPERSTIYTVGSIAHSCNPGVLTASQSLDSNGLISPTFSVRLSL
jgi:hypothetical protein